MAYVFGSIWDRFNRNALNELSKSIEYQGKSIQNLVAKGQLTPEQYAELLNTINSGTPKGVFDTLDDLSSAFPNGDDGVYITLDNGNWNYFNDSVWVSGGVYQSTGLNNNSITLEKLKNTASGKNMFDKSVRKQGKFLDPSTSEIITSYTFDTSEFIALEIGSTYTINNARSFAHFNEDRLMVGEVVDNFGSTPVSFVATHPYIQASFSKALIDKAQIEKGEEVTSYEPYKALISNSMLAEEVISENKLQKNIIKPEHFNGVITGKNKFDITTSIDAYLNPETNEMVSSGTYKTSDFISVIEGNKYTVQGARSIIFYNSSESAVNSIDNDTLTDVTFTAEYPLVRFSVHNNRVETAQLELGEEATAYESFRLVIPERYLEIPEFGGGEAYDQTLNTYDDVQFSSVSTYGISTMGEIPQGTLNAPPAGLVSGDVWADTTDSATQPILRVKL